MQLPWARRCGLAGGLLLPGGGKVAIIRGDGAIYEMDMATQKLDPTPVAGDCRQSLVVALQWPRSPDGANIYVGYGGLAPNGMSTSTELRIFNAATWRQLGGFRTSVPFWSAVTSREGKLIYALVPERHSALVIDTVTGQEKRAITIGEAPTLALIAP